MLPGHWGRVSSQTRPLYFYFPPCGVTRIFTRLICPPIRAILACLSIEIRSYREYSKVVRVIIAYGDWKLEQMTRFNSCAEDTERRVNEKSPNRSSKHSTCDRKFRFDCCTCISMKVQVRINLLVTTLGKHRRKYSLNTDLHSRSRNRKQKRNETIYREGHRAAARTEDRGKKKRRRKRG